MRRMQQALFDTSGPAPYPPRKGPLGELVRVSVATAASGRRSASIGIGSGLSAPFTGRQGARYASVDGRYLHITPVIVPATRPLGPNARTLTRRARSTTSIEGSIPVDVVNHLPQLVTGRYPARWEGSVLVVDTSPSVGKGSP